ncbi:ankyrin repeat protein [Nannizzia gypsea CBS 118893]|uniref:Ankyrin repeat protein n=1 Tax=Arthroderma gypseum (strain ATCC MYA-4604 / CBS 118893) TaxID=535722 RepID=E4V1D2_ARTGP|nr:ankyrin repeat protein [Nannizzia gypsea CBS 118893]EFR03847.1 ankyrin repeat protein [Nannizzia gypsea CBS 118893]
MCGEFEEHLLYQYDEETLVHHINRSKISSGSSSLFFLSPNLVAKRYPRGEESGPLIAIRRARQLGIPVPSIQRVVESHDRHNIYVISDRIRGRTLEDAWISLSWLRSLLLAIQLRRFVRKMRSLTSKTAGSLSDGKCRSMWLGTYYGLPPHASSEAITAFVRYWYNVSPLPSRKRKAAAYRASSSSPSILTGTAATFEPDRHFPLTFSHQDLAPRNIIVDEKFRLWLLDWDQSGWYPIYFEYVCMQNFSIPFSWGLLAKVRWWMFCWVSVGIYSKEQEVLHQALVNFTRFAVDQEGIPLQGTAMRLPAQPR